MSHDVGLGKSARNRIHEITGAQVQSLMSKLDVVWAFLPTIPLQELLCEDDYSPGEVCTNGGGKHVLQECSIIEHLRRSGAIHNRTTTAIEMGAGTARLSDRLQRVTGGTLHHVLVDRRAFQQSRDGALRARAEPSATVQRITCDIASLDMTQHVASQQHSLCMSKHLCGPACDLTIECLATCMVPCAVATCCHYLCEWDCFSGKGFWLQTGLTKQDFEVAVAASQWATVKKRTTMANAEGAVGMDGTDGVILPDLMKAAGEAKNALASTPLTLPTLSSDEFERTFSRKEKGDLGSKLKQLLDLARAARMQELGYKVKLVRYTTRSLDDRLLVGSIAEYNTRRNTSS